MDGGFDYSRPYQPLPAWGEPVRPTRMAPRFAVQPPVADIPSRRPVVNRAFDDEEGGHVMHAVHHVRDQSKMPALHGHGGRDWRGAGRLMLAGLTRSSYARAGAD